MKPCSHGDSKPASTSAGEEGIQFLSEILKIWASRKPCQRLHQAPRRDAVGVRSCHLHHLPPLHHLRCSRSSTHPPRHVPCFSLKSCSLAERNEPASTAPRWPCTNPDPTARGSPRLFISTTQSRQLLACKQRQKSFSFSSGRLNGSII